MINKKLRDFLNDDMPGIVLYGECDEAIIGFAHRCTQEPIAVYSRTLLVTHFMEEGMSLEEADEHVSFNIEGLWAGDRTPMIIIDIEAMEIE